MSPERGNLALLPNNKSMNYYNLEFNDRQISLLKTALDTRLQRINEMIKLFGEDPTDRAKWMEEQYCQEYLDVEYLQQIIKTAEAMHESGLAEAFGALGFK